MPLLTLSFFGGFQAQLDDLPIPHFRSANAQGLLVYCALQAERPFAREALGALFWPDMPDSVAKKNLRQALYQLRQLLPDEDESQPTFLVTRQTIQFNAHSHYSLDVASFLAALAEGDLATAVALYHGELLAGFTCDSLEFEAWLRQEREHLHRLALQAMSDLAERQLAQGKLKEAQTTARRQLALEPWQETAHRQIMQALALSGDRSGALAQYELCCQSLLAELGVEPAPETVALAERIQANDLLPVDLDLIAGRYALGPQIGQGAMGIVYRGRDTQTGQTVAIKMLDRSRVDGHPELVERFRREGEALRQLNHPNIVTMLAAAEKEGSQYLVMEYIEGGDLRQYLQAEPQPPLDRVLAIALDLSDALIRAHRLEILHRDLKPANVLLDGNGVPHLTDFGIAQLGRDSQLTQYGAILGTVSYLSPEACMGESLDDRADIWAFGLLLYEMLAGQRPFERQTPAATLMAILQEPIPDIRSFRSDLPDPLVDLLGQMLAKEKAARIPSVRLVGAALEALLRGQGEQTAAASAWPVKPGVPAATAVAAPEAPPVVTPARQAELVLLDKVYAYWIEGVLQQALREGTFIEVGLETSPEAVANPWQGIVRQPAARPEPIPADKSITQVFAENGRSLLILGHPGSGKTVLLLELARDLLLRAREAADEPMPVIFNLSSWANRARPLGEWLVDELNEKYLIPRKIGREWVDAERLTLLLDGLDEVTPAKQADCMREINQFRQNKGLVPMVLCCRSLVYEHIQVPVRLNGAISLRPLTSDQADRYLNNGGEQLENLQHVIHEDPVLQEIARSPLMLQVMSKAFRQEVSSAPLLADDFPAIDGERKEVLLAKIFDSYVNQMLVQLASTTHYSWEQAQRWLTWLAQKMNQQSQTVFLLESLQPGLLARRRQRWLYLLVTRFLLGGFVGVMLWMFGLVGLQMGAEHSRSSLLIAANSNLAIGWIDFIMAVGLHSLYGLVVGVVDIVFFERRRQEPAGASRSAWDWRRKGVMATAVGLAATLQLWLWGEDPFLLILQVLTAVFLIVLFTQYAFGQGYGDDVGTVEALRWSREAGRRGVLPAIGFGLIFSFIIWQLVPEDYSLMQIILFVGLPIGILIWSLAGLTGNVVESKGRPNEGIRLSAKNGLLGGLIVGGFLAVVVTLAVLAFRWQGQPVGRMMGVYTGVVSALIAGLMFGGFNVVNHYFLRFILWRSGQIPKDLVPFLDNAARHVLLYKVGGGFIFIHGLLQTHLAQKQMKD